MAPWTIKYDCVCNVKMPGSHQFSSSPSQFIGLKSADYNTADMWKLNV